MTVEIEITTDNILAYEMSPVHLSVNSDGVLYTKIVKNDEVTYKNVTIVNSGENLVNVTGLNDGDIVLTNGQAFVSLNDKIQYNIEIKIEWFYKCFFFSSLCSFTSINYNSDFWIIIICTDAKRGYPDIDIPMAYISVGYEGITPTDAEKLLAKPLEKHLRTVAGLDKMTSASAEGYSSVTLEFDAGENIDLILDDVRKQLTLLNQTFLMKLMSPKFLKLIFPCFQFLPWLYRTNILLKSS